MKKIILSLSIFVLALASQSFAQTTKEDVVLVSFEQMSASKAGLLNKLTYGKFNGFDQTEKAFIVKPADATKETLDNLIKEIKYKSADCTIKIASVEKKVVSPTAAGAKN